MQRLLKPSDLIPALLLLSAVARGDSTVANLPLAALPTPIITLYGDQGGVDTQIAGVAGINSDIATALNLNPAAAFTVRGNFTGSAGNDIDNPLPDCPPAGSQHVGTTPGVGFTCASGAVSPAYASSGPVISDPGAITSASFVQLGLGSQWSITPAVSGTLVIDMSFNTNLNVTNVNVGYKVTCNLGSALTKNTVLSGTPCSGVSTVCGVAKSLNVSATTAIQVGSLSCRITGLAVGVQAFLDIAAFSDGTHNLTISNIDAIALEVPS